MSDHTAGPWAHTGRTMDGWQRVTPPASSQLVSIVAKVRRAEDAVLIAAAPDLLAAAQLALQLIRDTWIEEHGSEQVGRAWGALHDAIEAATGGAS
jgi:hypothetical protein